MSQELSHIFGYQIDETIHQGPLTRVYRAHNPQGQPVAIKEFLGQQKILAEVSALVSVSHPRLVRCLDIIWEAQGRYLVFEFAPQGTLRQQLQQGPLGPEICQELARQVLEGLDQLHQQGIIHRDLKPENILRFGDDYKVTDFGLAGPRVANPHLGTPAYMAPEQFLGKTSAASDLYSLGCILWETLEGKRLCGGNFSELRQQHQRGLHPRLTSSTASPGLTQLVERLLELDPERRPRSARVALELLNSQAETSAPVEDLKATKHWGPGLEITDFYRLGAGSSRFLSTLHHPKFGWRLAWSDGVRAWHSDSCLRRSYNFAEPFEQCLTLESQGLQVLSQKKELRLYRWGETRSQHFCWLEGSSSGLLWQASPPRLFCLSGPVLSAHHLAGSMQWQVKLPSYAGSSRLALLDPEVLAVSVGPQPSRLLLLRSSDGRLLRQLELPGYCLGMLSYRGQLSLLSCPVEKLGQAYPGWLLCDGNRLEVIGQVPDEVYRARSHRAGFSLWRRGKPGLLCSPRGEVLLHVPNRSEMVDDTWMERQQSYAWLESEGGKTMLRSLQLVHRNDSPEEEDMPCSGFWSSIRWTA